MSVNNLKKKSSYVLDAERISKHTKICVVWTYSEDDVPEIETMLQ